MADLAKKYESGCSTIYNIIDRKEVLKNQWLSAQNPDLKNKCRKSTHEQVNAAVMEWFRMARAKGLPVSGPMLQEQARQFAEHYNDTEFKASNGWLDALKKRYCLVFNAVCGEARDVDQATVNDWVDKLTSIIDGYEEKDIENCDETALFFRAIPQKSLAFKGEQCSGGKMSKERLSVLLCAFADGVIENPLIIGKAAKLRCFKGLDTHWFFRTLVS